MERTTPLDKLIGANLKRLRVTKRMSASALGEGLQPPLTKTQISKYEVGVNRVPSSRLPEFAEILGAGVLDFYAGAEHLMKGKDVLVHIPSEYESDILVQFRKVATDLQPHIANLLAGLCKHFTPEYLAEPVKIAEVIQIKGDRNNGKK